MNKYVLRTVLYDIKTTRDGGWRITFDIDQSQTDELMKLSKHRETLLTTVVIEGAKELESSARMSSEPSDVNRPIEVDF